MPLVTLIVVLVAVGIVLYCINRFVPMDANIKNILNVVVILILVVWLLQVFGIVAMLSSVRVGG